MSTNYYFQLYIYLNTWPHWTSVNVEYVHIQLLIVHETRNTYGIEMTLQCDVFGAYAPLHEPVFVSFMQSLRDM